MSKPKKTEYERVRDVWYKKLADDGFNDIELVWFGGRGTSRSEQWKDPDLRQATVDYYCMAQHFLNEYEFDTEVEKIMWEYYSNGLSFREIAKVLNKTKVTKTNKDAVWLIIKRLEEIMKGLYLST